MTLILQIARPECGLSMHLDYFTFYILKLMVVPLSILIIVLLAVIAYFVTKGEKPSQLAILNEAHLRSTLKCLCIFPQSFLNFLSAFDWKFFTPSDYASAKSSCIRTTMLTLALFYMPACLVSWHLKNSDYDKQYWNVQISSSYF